jgi:hypothetical protein
MHWFDSCSSKVKACFSIAALLSALFPVALAWNSAHANEPNPQSKHQTPYYIVAHPSVKAVCWLDAMVCETPDEVFCDLETHGIPETINGRQVLVAKTRKTSECMRREILSRFQNSMHHSVTYRGGVRP